MTFFGHCITILPPGRLHVAVISARDDVSKKGDSSHPLLSKRPRSTFGFRSEDRLKYLTNPTLLGKLWTAKVVHSLACEPLVHDQELSHSDLPSAVHTKLDDISGGGKWPGIIILHPCRMYYPL